MILDREFGLLSGGKGALPLVQPAMFGPPERCFGHVQSSWPGLVFSADGKSAGFAFRIGRLFHDDGYADHRDIAVDALRAPFRPKPSCWRRMRPPQRNCFCTRCPTAERCRSSSTSPAGTA